MAATASQFYFRFLLLWLRSLGKVEIYLPTKFRRNISIHGWDITTSRFWKQTFATLEFYFRFQILRLRNHRHDILLLPTKLRPNRTIRDRVMTSYPFFKMAAVSDNEFSQGNCKPPTKCEWDRRSILKFRVNRIYGFGDIVIFMSWNLAWKLKLPIYVVICQHAQNEGLIYFRSRS